MRLTFALLAALTASPALAGGLGEMTDAERSAFRDEVKAFLMEHPEVIVEAMTELQAREELASADRDVQMLAANQDAIFNSPGDWVGGNPDGDITVVEFMDYRCGYCRKAYQEVEDLVSSDGNIRFVLKEFPILGEESLYSAQFAVAVRMLYGDDAYKAAHDALVTLRGPSTPETLGRLATDLGHDPAAVTAKMESSEVEAVIMSNHALANALEINGTPTFVVNGTMLRGYVPLDGMREIVASERQDG